MRPANSQRQRGETLVGLLIGLSLGLLVLAGGSLMLAQLLRGHRQALQLSHLQQDLHFALDLAVAELQDAQYSAKAWATRSPASCSDDFCDGSEDFSLGVARIDWSLDRDHDGLQDNDECTGLRLKAGALQLRTACNPEVWTALSDTTSVDITGFEARVHCQWRAGWVDRRVQLRLQARRPGPMETALDVTRSVTLRNPLPLAVLPRYCP